MENNTLDKFGDKIYELRKQKNLSQDDLAEKVGVSRQTVSKWEADIIQPRADKLQRICNALEVDLNYFALRDDSIDEICETDVESSDVACDIVHQNENSVYELNDKKGPRNSVKKKVIAATIIFSVIFIIGISMILFSTMIKTPEIEGGFGDVYDSFYFNFSIENIGWILFGLALTGLCILAIIIICHKLKTIKKSKGN